MSRIAITLAVAGLSCSAPGPAPSPTPTPNPPPPTVTKPMIPEVVKVATDPAPDDCVAGGHEGGLLDQSSPSYRRIEVADNGQWISEKAWMRDSSVIVTASLGGCAHFGATYVVDMESSTPVTDKAAHLGAALTVVRELALRPGTTSFIKEIGEELEKPGADFNQCHFQRGEIDSVYCGVSATDGATGRVSVSLTYDVAL